MMRHPLLNPHAPFFLAAMLMAMVAAVPTSSNATSHVNPCAWIVSPVERQACMERRGIQRPQLQSRIGLPTFDPQGHCDRVSRVAGSRSNMIRLGCLQMEQAAYDRLRTYWDRVPTEIQRHCIDVARTTSRDGSYELLDGCLRMEIQDGREADRFQFRR
jgi:hypothetical protein